MLRSMASTSWFEENQEEIEDCSSSSIIVVKNKLKILVPDPDGAGQNVCSAFLRGNILAFGVDIQP